MADLIRSANSGRDWSMNEMLAYNIIVRRENAVEFFGHELGSIDHLDPNLLSATDPTVDVDFSKNTYRFLAYLYLASSANSGRESAIGDFGRSVLEVTGFEEKGAALRTRYEIPLTICRDDLYWSLDICLVLLNSPILLIAQENKANYSMYKSEAQVIAGAIAAFQHTNTQRLKHFDRPCLASMTIPCIAMIGTRPFFYKVPVTMQLSTAVAAGKYPEQPTIVTCCLLPPGTRHLKAWRCPIIGGLPYSIMTHSVGWRKVAGLRP